MFSHWLLKNPVHPVVRYKFKLGHKLADSWKIRRTNVTDSTISSYRIHSSAWL